MLALTDLMMQLSLGILATLVVAGTLSFWRRYKHPSYKGLTKVAFWHEMELMQDPRKAIIICLALGAICWFVFSGLVMARATLLGLLGGILLSIPIGFLLRAVREKRQAAASKKEQEARAAKDARIKAGLGVYSCSPHSDDVVFLSSSGQFQQMRAIDFVERRLPKNEEPETWIVRHISNEHLYLISKFGWSFLIEGESRPHRDKRAIWIQDRYGREHHFILGGYNAKEGDLYKVLMFVTTYESVKDYVQSYRDAEVAKALRATKSTTRSTRIARAAGALEMSPEELTGMFKDNPSPNIAQEILKEGSTHNANAA